MEEPTNDQTVEESGDTIAETAVEAEQVEITFEEPINFAEYDENDLSIVLRQRMKLKDSTGGKSAVEARKDTAKELMANIETILNFREDEKALQEMEIYYDRLMQEKMKKAIIENEEEELDEDDEDNEDNDEDTSSVKAKMETSSVKIDAKKTSISSKEIKWVETHHLPEKSFQKLRSKLVIKYPFELDGFQKQAVMRLEKRQHVFVAAHTSAGKTVVAEYAIALAMKNHSRAIYTSPIKALSNQKFRDFREKFGIDNVGIVTGDVSVNPQAQCLIVTTEIFRSMLYKGADMVRDIEFVVFDEVHYVNDVERGVVWEEVIIMLPESITLIFLSATTPNAPQFSEWIGRMKRRKVYLISTNKRPVPLQHYLYHDQEMYKLMEGEGKLDSHAIQRCINKQKEKMKPKEMTANNAAMKNQRIEEKANNAAMKAGGRGNGPKQQQIKQQVYQQQAKYNQPNKGGNVAGYSAPQNPSGSKQQWLQLLKLLQAGGREASGGLGEVNLGVGTARHVLSTKARKEKSEMPSYESLPKDMKAKMTKTEYEQQEIRGSEDEPDKNLSGVLPVVIFSFSKKKCEEIANFLKGQDLLVATEKSKVMVLFSKVTSRLTPEDAELPQIHRMRELLLKGIGVHHGGLLPILKEIVEILFSQSIVKVLLATETFAMGVNMPARCVVFNGIKKHDGREFRELLSGEYIQMAGRAGRRGLDAFGVVILTAWLENPPAEHQIRKLLTGQPISLASKFRLRYNMILNLLRVNNLSVADMIKQSFTEFASQKLLASHNIVNKLSQYERYLHYVEEMQENELENSNAISKKITTTKEENDEDDDDDGVKEKVKILYNNFASMQTCLTEQFLFLFSVRRTQNYAATETTMNRLLAVGQIIHVGLNPSTNSHPLVLKLPTPAAVKPPTASSSESAAAVVEEEGIPTVIATEYTSSLRTALYPTFAVILTDPVMTLQIELQQQENKKTKATATGTGTISTVDHSSQFSQMRNALLNGNNIAASTTSDNNNNNKGNVQIMTKLTEQNCSVWVMLLFNHPDFPVVSVPPNLSESLVDDDIFEFQNPTHRYGKLYPLDPSSHTYYLITKISFKDIGFIYGSLKLSSLETLPAAAISCLELASQLESMMVATMVNIADETMTLKDLYKEEKISDVYFKDRQERIMNWSKSYHTQFATIATIPQYPFLYNRKFQHDKIVKKISLMQRCISDESLSLFPDFKQRLGILGLLGYLHQETQTITTKGRVACEINTCDELLGTEILFHNVLEPLNPPEAVAMLSALVFQEKNDVNDALTSRMEMARTSMQQIHDEIMELQEIEGIENASNDPDSKPILNFGLCAVVYQWARGIPFKDIITMTEFQEGSIVRAITRLDELCRDVSKAAQIMGNPILYAKMEAASQCIKRDIVFAASLYISGDVEDQQIDEKGRLELAL
jgi:superfamily II RNA helicase